jgi:hypothetical protein
MTASVVSWSEFLATDPEARVRYTELPDFLRSSGSGTEKVAARIQKTDNTAVGIRRADHVALSIHSSLH